MRKEKETKKAKLANKQNDKSGPGALLFGNVCIILSISSVVTGEQYILFLHR